MPKHRKVMALAFAVAVVLGICGGGAALGVDALIQHTDLAERLSTTMTVSGTITLDYGDYGNNSRDCFGRGGYGDLHLGTPVVITDASGQTVAIGKISATSESDWRCKLSFRVEDVPKGTDFYGVTIAKRETLQLSASDMAKPLDLSLGR